MPMVFLILTLVCNLVFAQQGDVQTDEDQTDNIYIIQSGDTLWDISQTFIGDPESWPELWSINEYITNPHWIYPGNKIVFTMGTLLEPPKVDLNPDDRNGYQVEEKRYESTEATCGPDVHFDFKQRPGIFTVNGFIRPKNNIQVVGTVAKSPRSHSFLVEKHLVYLKVNDLDKYECGDILTVFRKIKKRVRHPESYFTNYGSLYEIAGEVKVVHKFGNYLTASIRTSWTEIQRGDLIGPKRNSTDAQNGIPPVVIQTDVEIPSGEKLRGTIIERLAQRHNMTANRDTVFLDRGKDDGVQVGDTFYIINQKDEFIDKNKTDPTVPPSVIGKVVVVDVNQNSSTAVVTDSSRSIFVGDVVSQHVD